MFRRDAALLDVLDHFEDQLGVDRLLPVQVGVLHRPKACSPFVLDPLCRAKQAALKFVDPLVGGPLAFLARGLHGAVLQWPSWTPFEVNPGRS